MATEKTYKISVKHAVENPTLNGDAVVIDNGGLSFVKIHPVDAVEVVHGRWELTAHEEHSNFRWNVTAECSECHHSKGEIYAGFFSGFPKDLARDVVLDCAKSVKLDNYCPNCGAEMDGDGNA